eukprot:GABW01003427.1.p1 GENE.GABW01003427.1~~GABW01003427.1.p1  ORF type:complete len:76 (-),score=22.63 GABW01003427.1:3-230(-)
MNSITNMAPLPVPSSGVVHHMVFNEDKSVLYIAGAFVGPYTVSLTPSLTNWFKQEDLPVDIDYTGIAQIEFSHST